MIVTNIIAINVLKISLAVAMFIVFVATIINRKWLIAFLRHALLDLVTLINEVHYM